jgi:hypothetical protein
MKYTFIMPKIWVGSDGLQRIWMAVSKAPLLTTLEEVNKVTEAKDRKLSKEDLITEYARRRAFVVSQFKGVAVVIADNMFPGGQKGLEFANFKMSALWPETGVRYAVIKREFFFILFVVTKLCLKLFLLKKSRLYCYLPVSGGFLLMPVS